MVILLELGRRIRQQHRLRHGDSAGEGVGAEGACAAGGIRDGSESRSWLHILGLAAILAVTIYVIVDLEYPRLGFFQIADFDQLLVEVRAGMR